MKDSPTIKQRKILKAAILGWLLFVGWSVVMVIIGCLRNPGFGSSGIAFPTLFILSILSIFPVDLSGRIYEWLFFTIPDWLACITFASVNGFLGAFLFTIVAWFRRRDKNKVKPIS
jgi:membrane-bound ClpP family serine protease